MRRNARVVKSTHTNLELGVMVRERDDDIRQNGPVTQRTPFGVWSTALGGTSSTAYDEPHPIRIQSKRKYTRT